MGFNYCEEYLRIHQTKYYYGSVKKSKCSFSCHFQVVKKINNVNKKKIQEGKLIQTLLMRF